MENTNVIPPFSDKLPRQKTRLRQCQRQSNHQRRWQSAKRLTNGQHRVQQRTNLRELQKEHQTFEGFLLLYQIYRCQIVPHFKNLDETHSISFMYHIEMQYKWTTLYPHVPTFMYISSAAWAPWACNQKGLRQGESTKLDRRLAVAHGGARAATGGEKKGWTATGTRNV